MLYLKYFLITAVLLYIAVAILLYFFQEKLLFFPVKLADDYQFTQFQNTEENYFDLKHSVRLHCLEFRVQNPKGCVIYFHGNAGALDGWGIYAEDFRQRGYDVWMPDYRGYGKSKGRISQRSFYRDALFIYEQVLKHFPEEKIILYGRSLGSGVACQLATKTRPQQLILETPYSSIVDMAKHTVPYFPVQWILRYPFRSDLNIKKINCPVHFFHGTADALIPYEQAQRLAKISGVPDVLTTIEGGTHNNLPDFEEYQMKLDELLR